MKQVIKTMTVSIVGILLTFGLTLSACKKVEKGPAGPTGLTGATGATGANGPEAKTYNVTYNYAAGETYRYYSGVTDFEPDDALLIYLVYTSVGGETLCTPISATVYGVDYLTLFAESTGAISFYTYSAGTYSSPWSTNQEVRYKIVHIKSSGLIKHPNVDLSNYEDVKVAYNL